MVYFRVKQRKKKYLFNEHILRPHNNVFILISCDKLICTQGETKHEAIVVPLRPNMDFIVKFIPLFLFTSCIYSLPPIVIVPGIGGSQLQAKLHRNESEYSWCYKQYESWFTIWLTMEELLPLISDCWLDNMKLVYDSEGGKMVNTPGVYVKVPDFGNTTGIEWLDPSFHIPGIYFYPFVDALTKLLGYKRGTTMKAAPYDFRYDPDSLGDYFERLKNMIEKSYVENNNKQVMLISHSMGVPCTLKFLHGQTQVWKDKYLHAWISISGVFAGSVKAVLAYISGDGFGIPRIIDKPITLRTLQRSFSSLSYILPDDRFWGEDEVIVKTANRSYTVKDFDDLFDDLDYPLGKTIRKMVPSAWSAKPPGVKMYCFHGNHIDTPSMLSYGAGFFPDYVPFIDYNDGDGTVNIRSLEACNLWKDQQPQPIIYEVFSNSEHNGILGDTRLIRKVVEALNTNHK